MKKYRQISVVVCGLLALFLSCFAEAARSSVILEDSFSYSGWASGTTPMNKNWTMFNNTGAAPAIVTTNTSQAAPYVTVPSAVLTCPLGQTITGSWSLTINGNLMQYDHRIWVALMNSTGTQGYGFSWQTASSPKGYVNIRKLTVTKPSLLTVTNYGTTLLPSNIGSGYTWSPNAVPKKPFAQFELDWNQATGQLSLYVDHVLRGTVVDKSYNSFSQVYLGTNHGMFQSLVVSTGLGLAGATPTPTPTPTTGASPTPTGSPSPTASATPTPGVSPTTGASATPTPVASATPAASPTPAATPEAGASVPFTTYEAEDPANATTGQVVVMTGMPSATSCTPEMEASGRGYVALTAQGQYLDFKNVRAANTIVIRNCIPDAPGGGGITATLSLYVNGVFRQSLSLSSKHNWLYGVAGGNGQVNTPSSGSPHVYWDEARFFITGGVNAGDTLRLEKGSSDTAAFYYIDLIDLEQVGPALSPPTSPYLSVMDYGATGNGTTDDTAAIQNCINAAQTAGKIVWIPAGNYLQSALFNLNGVTVQGAGMWYTNILGNSTGGGFNGNIGFALAGSNAQVHDLSIDSLVHTSRNDGGGLAFTSYAGAAKNWTVQNVWITHTLCGFWLGGSTNGTITGCRVRCTYADAINLNWGSCNNLVENNHIRGEGDDGMAILADTAVPTISANNTLRYNTVIAPWWGHNCDLAGGGGHVIEYNYLADNAWSGCFTINLPPAYPMNNVTSATIRYNMIVRGGGNLSSQQRGAVWIYPDGGVTISGVVFEYNNILDSIFHGIHLTGTSKQQITFNNNVIDYPGSGAAVFIESGVTGSGVFNSNTVTHLTSGQVQFQNNSTTYTVSGSGNSW